jgi:membrane fusion protein (multidrug efflux system)
LLAVKIIYDEIEQIGVPESSVTIQGKTAFVYVVNGETVDKTNIQIGKRNFGKVSVLDGVSEGDQIVVEGVSKVRDKSKIKIIKQKNR